MAENESLDARRPRFLRHMVGNAMVKQRLGQQMKNGTVPQRVFLFGPTGSGKTTIARILARHFFCRNRLDVGDPCGRCPNCLLRDLDDLPDCYLCTAAHLEPKWNWWQQHGPSILRRSFQAFILDEAQDLGELHQKWFYDELESATALVIFATTHKNKVIDALLNRFGANAYEMSRPSIDESIELLTRTCTELNVRATEQQLARVVRANSNDLRKCIDFVYTAKDQACDKIVTDEFIDAIVGRQQSGRDPDEVMPSRRRSSKL